MPVTAEAAAAGGTTKRVENPLRVVYVHHGKVPGGAPVSLSSLVAALSEEMAIEPRIACINDTMAGFFAARTGADTTVIPDPGVALGKMLIGWAPLWRVGTWLALPAALARLPHRVRRCTEWLQREQPDVVHLNSATLVTVALAARRAAVPCVWHVREINLGRRWNPRRWLAGWLIRRLATAVVAISPAEARSLGPDRRGKVRVVYNFVDESSFHDRAVSRTLARRDLGLPEDARVVATLGGVSFRKGAWQLVESMRLLPDDTHLVVAGPPLVLRPPGRRVRWVAPFLLRVEDVLVKFRLRAYHLWCYNERVRRSLLRAPRDRVHFTGVIDDVRPVLVACDVLVFAGTTPHFPRPVYEAWMMQRPVAIFDVEGVRDNVEHDVDGVVAFPLSAEALAGAVGRVLAEPSRARAMAAAGHEKALARFTTRPAMRRMRQIYEEITGGAAPAARSGKGRAGVGRVRTS